MGGGGELLAGASWQNPTLLHLPLLLPAQPSWCFKARG